MIGTLAPTIIYGQKSLFVLFLGISCFIADLIYLLLLALVYKRPDEDWPEASPGAFS